MVAGVRRGVLWRSLSLPGRVASSGVIRGGGSGGGRRAGGRRPRLMGDVGGRPGVVTTDVGGRPRVGVVPGVSGEEGRGSCAARCSVKCIHICWTPRGGPGGEIKEFSLPFLQRAELEGRAEGRAVLWRPQAGP